MNKIKLTFICCYNNEEQFSSMLLPSINNLNIPICEIDSIFIDTKNPKYKFVKSAASAYNFVLNTYRETLGDILIFVHQDIAFDNSLFLQRIITELSTNPRQILGFAGVIKDVNVKILSNLKYRRTNKFITGYQVENKEKVFSLDECCFALKKEWCLKILFDEIVCFHWHLYAVDLCYALKFNYGINSYVLPEIIYHKEDNSTGLYTDKYYFKSMWNLLKKYKSRTDIIYTTCFVCRTNLIFAFVKIIKTYFYK